MKTHAIALPVSKMASVRKQIITKVTLGLTLLMLMFMTQSCKKDALSGPDGGGGSLDPRIVGTWQNQEILGSGGTTLTNVAEITFSEDGTGREETFSIGPFGTSAREGTDFTWEPSGSKVRMQFPNATVQAQCFISEANDVMRLTFDNGNKILYTRHN